MENKRKNPRAAFALPVTVVPDQVPLRGHVKNISRGGVLLYLPVHLNIGEDLRIAMEPAECDDVISANGEVARAFPVQDENGRHLFGIGVRFTEISEENLRYFTGRLEREWREEYKGSSLPWQYRVRHFWKTIGGITALLFLALLAYTILPSNQEIGEATPIPEPEESEHLAAPDMGTNKQLVAKQDISVKSQMEGYREVEQQRSAMVEETGALKEEAAVEKTTFAIKDQPDRLEKEVTNSSIKINKLTVSSQPLPGSPAPVNSKQTPKKSPGTVEEPAIFHIVHQGENIYRIGLKYNMSVNLLLKRNNLAPGAVIYPGQKLLISPSR